MRTNYVPTVREILYQDIKGVSQRGISQSLGVSRTTIQKYCQIAKSLGYNKLISDQKLEEIALEVHQQVYHSASNRHKAAMLAIEPYHDRIIKLLNEPWITHKQIHRVLKADGLKTSVRSISRYIESHFPKTVKSTIHLVTVAGEEAQVDYGYVGIINHRKTYAFIMTLSHSRYRYVEFVTSQNEKSWAQSHINAFAFFGAVPRCVLLDNLKSGVISANIYDPVINQTYSELARHYGFVADPAKARTPQHKGKVERSVQMVKEQIIAGKDYHSLEQLNEYSKQWCTQIVCHEICSSTGRTPMDIFKHEELSAMLPLTANTFDMPVWTQGKVHQDHHFTLNGNFYSMPSAYIGEIIQVRSGLKTVRAYSNHQLIKTHIKAEGKGKWVTDQNDYPEHVAAYLANNTESALASAKEIGQATFQFMQSILTVVCKTTIRKSAGILRLNETYGSDRLENACLRSIAYDNYDYKSLKRILEEGLDNKETKSFSVKLPKGDISQSAYIRPASNYSSSMEVNHG